MTETLESLGTGAARLTLVPVLASTVTGRTVQRPLPAPALAVTSLPVALDGALPKTGAVRANGAVPAANTTSPVCAVPRLDTRRQVLQPDHQRVEWAVDQAVLGDLTIQRPANFGNMGLPAYSPDGDIPVPALVGGGSIPPQILLGVLAQESNFWQASWHALPGVAGNPLVADYYGAGYNNIDTIDYDNADCGYGVGQITTGMTLASASYWGFGDATAGAQVQAKIAVDYAENIAAAAYLLSQKWNQLASYNPAILANGGNPAYTSNWYMALWAYNSGINPQASTGNTTGCTPGPACTDAQGYWGLGWANNPANPDWLPSRLPFLQVSYADAATPQDWPYQEKVLGWSARPLLDYTATPSYTPTASYPQIPPNGTFCTSADNCDFSQSQPCELPDFHCWWHLPVAWVSCATTPVSGCPQGTSTYAAGDESEPADPDPHPADCNSTLPANAVIVDDEPADLNVVGCNRSTENWTSQGTFTLTQGTNSAGTPISVVDTHQIGAGFGGHLYFTHNIVGTDTEHLVTGTWAVSLPTGAYHVLVHIPATGGTTTSADYQITTSSGTVYSAIVNQYQQQDMWVGVGYYGLGANAKATLNNVTSDQGVEAHDVAYDAVAFVPAAGTVVNHQFVAVSLFDWNQNLNTSSPSFLNTPSRTMTTLHDWAIDYGYQGPWWNGNAGTVRGVSSYPKCPTLNEFTSSCVPADVWNVGSTWATDAETAGTAPPASTTPVMSEPQWLGFSNPTPGPATMTSSTYSDDGSYKIKTELDVSFVVNGGKIVPGSQQVTTLARTGDTHIPGFVSGFMHAVQTDYGITPPNLSYDEADANTYTGDATPVSPLSTGYEPGRALVWHADAPTITSNNTCVAERAISGGEIGWRPAVAQSPVSASVQAWVTALQNDGAVNPSVTAMAGEIYNFFFNDALWGSVFGQAPPIWQEAHLQFCANGSISSTSEEPNTDDGGQLTLVDQSLMPDLYLYYDGKLVNDTTGSAATSPVQKGNFNEFSGITGPDGYNGCQVGASGNAGNPWDLSPGAPADAIPLTGSFCDNPGEDFGSPYPGG